LAEFGDTRNEEEICSVILTEIAVKSLNSIHSIVVGISYPELEASRGAKLKYLQIYFKMLMIRGYNNLLFLFLQSLKKVKQEKILE
jgi:hypothetical protein